MNLPTLSNLPGRETLARSQALRRSWPFVMDVAVAAIGLAAFYCIVLIAKFWAGPPNVQMVVSLSPRALPLYAFYSVVRIFLAYVLSLIFAVSYGYLAAYSTRVEPFLIAVLDILQSIPVLSFLPGVMLAMVGLFPTRHLGVELGAIILIFTGAVWNMAFSFYSSLKSIPRELLEATRVYRYSRLQRLVQLELPYAAIGLLWNSIMSVAGAWFFLMACEMFHLGARDFRLPGLGSYLQTAADAGNGHAIAYGLSPWSPSSSPPTSSSGVPSSPGATSSNSNKSNPRSASPAPSSPSSPSPTPCKASKSTPRSPSAKRSTPSSPAAAKSA